MNHHPLGLKLLSIFFSVRARLTLLLLVAILPGFGMAFYISLEMNRMLMQEAEDTVWRMAQGVSDSLTHLVEGTRQTLITLDLYTPVRQMDDANCSVYFAETLQYYPLYQNLAAVKPNGDVYCSGKLLKGPLNISSLPAFAQMRQQKGFSITGYTLNETGQRPTFMASYALHDRSTHVVIAYAYAAFDLDYLYSLLAGYNLLPDMTVTLLDERGLVLLDYPAADDGEAGRRYTGISEQDLARALSEPGGLAFRAVGLDGAERIYGAHPVNSTADSGQLVVLVSRPAENVFAESKNVVNFYIGGLLLAAALALAFTWTSSRKMFLDKIELLLNATRRLTAGDLSARTGVNNAWGELNQLSLAFDQMATMLQQRTRQTVEVQEALKESQKRYLDLVDNFPNGAVLMFDRDLRFTLAGGLGLEEVGLSKEAMQGRTLFEVFPAETAQQIEPLYRAALAGRNSVEEIAYRGIMCEQRIIPIYDENGVITSGLVMTQNITERKRAEEASRRSEERFRLLFNEMLDGFAVHDILCDGDGKPVNYRFLEVNPAFERMTGLKAQAIIGKTVLDVLPETESYWIETYGAVALTGEPAFLENYSIELGKYFEVTAFQTRPGQFAVIFSDVTKRRLAEEEIRRFSQVLEQQVNERTAQLQAANHELEAFSYSVSHDLRAPLRSMDSFSQALLEDYSASLDDTGKNFLQRIRAASRRMAELIDDILRLSRVTRAEMNIAPVNLSQLAQEITDELRQSQPERQAHFVIAPDVVVQADRPLMRALLQNLLGNAWKFTAHHVQARIEFGVTQKDQEVIYFIKDDGAGFDMRYADKLFGAFQRLHTTDQFEGTGIGLATVQRIVLRHGGRVWAEAAVEQGAAFFFTISPH